MRKKPNGLVVVTEHGREYLKNINKNIVQGFETIESLSRSIERNPSDPKAWFHRSMKYSKKGLLPEALADLNRVMELDPHNATVYGNRSGIYIRLGDFNRAIADCDRALKLKPAYAVAWFNRGYAHFKKKATALPWPTTIRR